MSFSAAVNRPPLQKKLKIAYGINVNIECKSLLYPKLKFGRVSLVGSVIKIFSYDLKYWVRHLMFFFQLVLTSGMVTLSSCMI